MKLVVGLGNPGKRYHLTRHNVGFLALDTLTSDWQDKPKFQGEIGKWNGCILLKPTTFMNNSGKAVRAVMDYYEIAAEDIIVVYDDKDLPFGTIRYRAKGSSGGHNGIKSIIEHCKTEEFARLKIGIGPHVNEGDSTRHKLMDTAAYVLSLFTKEELEQLTEILGQTKDRIGQWLPQHHI